MHYSIFLWRIIIFISRIHLKSRQLNYHIFLFLQMIDGIFVEIKFINGRLIDFMLTKKESYVYPFSCSYTSA